MLNPIRGLSCVWLFNLCFAHDLLWFSLLALGSPSDGFLLALCMPFITTTTILTFTNTSWRARTEHAEWEKKKKSYDERWKDHAVHIRWMNGMLESVICSFAK